jgi:hypothetical protein
LSSITVYRDRTTIIPVSLYYDVSADTIVSEIRVGRSSDSQLIATWDIEFKTDGKDGQLIFTLDDSTASLIDHAVGYMDVKRISGGEPFNVFDEIIEVIFKDSITA